LIVKTTVAGGGVIFSTFSFKDKTTITNDTTDTTTTSSSSSSTNWPLIIGVVIGGVGFLVLMGFLIFYIIKRRK